MPCFITRENQRQYHFKQTWPGFSAAARGKGRVQGHEYACCLPTECAEENLFEETREDVLDYFARNRIKWHMGVNRRPSNHMRSSQICCVNFLEAFATRPEALTALLQPLYGQVTLLPIEEGRYVAYEWIGAQNYLQEKLPRSKKRQRGALFTSADAAILFRRADNLRQAVLIEWKYTEAYSPRSLIIAGSGTDRRDIYRHLWERDDCPLDCERIGCFDALFYEPFYQLMRQQFLAREMERTHELGADVVSTLHIGPADNARLERITSPALRDLGTQVTEVWGGLVQPPDRFAAVTTGELFGGYAPDPAWGLDAWQAYIQARYGSIL